MVKLQAVYTHVKSHYGKAHVLKEGNTILLQSYNTIVAWYNEETKDLKVYGEYSLTTMRHLTDFINQFTHIHVHNNDDIRALIY